MPWTTTTPIDIWAVISIPVFFLLWIFPPKAKLTAILVWLCYLAGSLYAALVINWALVNYWLRVAPVLLTIVLGIVFWVRNRTYFDFKLGRIIKQPFLPGKSPLNLVVLVFCVLLLLGLVGVNILALRTLNYSSYSGKPVLLLYPMRYGFYVATNGGNGLDGIGMSDTYRDWLGRKTGDEYLAYAVDMMKMHDNRGWTSQGILPKGFVQYESFRDWVYAPCVGKVVYVEDGHEDVVLGTPETPLGNRVVLQCFEYYVTVANLRKDSILVKEGDQIGFRVQLGLVGSSGSPSIPHLRVFTTLGSWDEKGTPVPQLFDTSYRFLVRNDIFLPPY